MSYLARLKAATSRKELAAILGYAPKSLTAIVYQTPQDLKYTTFDINKKSGGKRTIKAPIPKLKKLQSHLSHVLYQCLAEIEKERGAKPISFGFRRKPSKEASNKPDQCKPKLSIIGNAARHKRHRWVLNIDLEDFFPSFHFGRVRGFFLKDKAFSLHPEVATTIAQIACDGTALPQGSPCSPVISELIAQILDMRMVRLAKRYGVTYTRYADDITFSTGQKAFPSGLANADPTDSSIWHLSEELVSKITESGFTINHAKTRMHFFVNRQMVTGLVVNEKVNIRSDYYRRARAMCDSLFKTGQYFQGVIPSEKDGEDPKPLLTSNLSPLEGILSHIYTVTQHEDRRDVDEQRKNPRAIRKLYRRFLFYKYFLALKAPLIVTEGKTDPIYLREAVKSRTSFHPVLGAPGKNGFQHAVRYFNYIGSAHEILGLYGGGSSNLKSIPLEYQRNLDPGKKRTAINHCPMHFPVIIVLDNDDGLKNGIADCIKKNFKKEISIMSKNDFYHVIDNLYIVKTPENGENCTCIEDLFPKHIQEEKLNGKDFNPSNKIDADSEYGKEVFAKSIVRPKARAGEIDFSGFDPLLDRICKAIQHYADRPFNSPAQGGGLKRR